MVSASSWISSTVVEGAVHLDRELLAGIDGHRRYVWVLIEKRCWVRLTLMFGARYEAGESGTMGSRWRGQADAVEH
jgi:hypothetical protein